MIGFTGVISWLVWFVGVCTIVANRTRDWKPSPTEAIQPAGNGRLIWCFAACMILVWGFALPFTQPEQQLRHAVETSLAENRIAEAVHLMSQHNRDDFPPHWTPPPHLVFANRRPPLLDVLEIVLDEDAAPWVRSIFVEKLEAELYDSWSFRWYWTGLEAAQKDRLLSVVERLPEGVALVSRYPNSFSEIVSNEEEDDLRNRARVLLTKAGHDPAKAK